MLWTNRERETFFFVLNAQSVCEFSAISSNRLPFMDGVLGVLVRPALVVEFCTLDQMKVSGTVPPSRLYSGAFVSALTVGGLFQQEFQSTRQ